MRAGSTAISGRGDGIDRDGFHVDRATIRAPTSDRRL
jgi:hypothetical protein